MYWIQNSLSRAQGLANFQPIRIGTVRPIRIQKWCISSKEIENIHSGSLTPSKCEFYGQFSKVLHHTIFMG